MQWRLEDEGSAALNRQIRLLPSRSPPRVRRGRRRRVSPPTTLPPSHFSLSPSLTLSPSCCADERGALHGAAAEQKNNRAPPTFLICVVCAFICELLSLCKFPGDDIPIIRGSALSALQGTNDEIGKNAILKLMDAADAYIPDPVRVLDKNFLMPIEDVFSIQGCGTVLIGRVEHGTSKTSENVSAVLGFLWVHPMLLLQ